MKAFEKSCYLLPWPEVSEILTDEVEKHLGRHVPCWAKYEDESFWCADQAGSTPPRGLPNHAAQRLSC
ncbi:MAG: hypothetical protein HFE91_01525 [Acutalibacter sp.]|jgi:hypothetical protein|uniref:hypothetical protein n=1 Tax=Acutalibacter sp. TaxID=1918636 RepID=UPI00216ED104|nr:hypothetical protein [Acutalibacter sp.]MCI9224131.1 hypothetical protein [Acutalibacter sp.]